MKKIILIPLALLIAMSINCGKEEKQDDIKVKNIEEESKQEEKQKVTSEKDEVIKYEEEPQGDFETSKKYKEKKKKAPVRIKSTEAKSYVGEYAIVQGYVASVYESEKVAYLNFEKSYPDNPFTAAIFAKHFSDFDDLLEYENRTVEVKGKITEYKGKPQIILNSEDQIKIVN
jgi:hypothetical protein